MGECEEVACPPGVSGCDSPEMLELVEASFDQIAELVGLEIVGDDPFSGGVAGDYGFGALVCDQGSYRSGIIGLVSQYPQRREPLQQGRGKGRIATLAGGENEPERPAAPIDGHVDFGCQSSSGASQSLVPPFWPPPFPVAACWWARTRLESMEI